MITNLSSVFVFSAKHKSVPLPHRAFTGRTDQGSESLLVVNRMRGNVWSHFSLCFNETAKNGSFQSYFSETVAAVVTRTEETEHRKQTVSEYFHRLLTDTVTLWKEERLQMCFGEMDTFTPFQHLDRMSFKPTPEVVFRFQSILNAS